MSAVFLWPVNLRFLAEAESIYWEFLLWFEETVGVCRGTRGRPVLIPIAAQVKPRLPVHQSSPSQIKIGHSFTHFSWFSPQYCMLGLICPLWMYAVVKRNVISKSNWHISNATAHNMDMGSTFTKIPPSIFYITFNPPPPHLFPTLSSRHFKALFCQNRRSSIGNQKLRFPSLYTISNPDPDLSLHCSRETPQSWTLDKQGALLSSAMLKALAKIIALQKIPFVVQYLSVGHN